MTKSMYGEEHKEKKKTNGFWRWYFRGLKHIVSLKWVNKSIAQTLMGITIASAGTIVVATYFPLPWIIATIIGGVTLAVHGCWLYERDAGR